VDATDRLLLDTAAAALSALGPGELVIVGDHYGALTLGAAGRHGCTGIRVHQDELTGELALAANAERFGLAGCYRNLPLADGLFQDAGVVLIQAPKSLDALREIVEQIAQDAPVGVQLYLGGRVKHLTPSMNQVLALGFEQVQAGLARQKSRVITAGRRRAEPVPPSFPRQEWHPDLGLRVCAHGAAFAGTRIDVGTRRLLGLLDQIRPAAAEAIDLGCGTGVLAAALAASRPELRVLATDSSSAAVASARATAAANDLAGRITVQRDDAMSTLPPASAELIVCNPPFHLGTAVHEGAAGKLFRASGRVLRPGGELWTVSNAHLDYRPELRMRVGPTRVVHRDPKFTVTVSTAR
jgi:16S rRNA (guanine1207-N2)-methyltransferase